MVRVSMCSFCAMGDHANCRKAESPADPQQFGGFICACHCWKDAKAPYVPMVEFHPQSNEINEQPKQILLSEADAMRLLCSWCADGNTAFERQRRVSEIYAIASGGEQTLAEMWLSIKASATAAQKGEHI